jgi:hypothetical protein
MGLVLIAWPCRSGVQPVANVGRLRVVRVIVSSPHRRRYPLARPATRGEVLHVRDACIPITTHGRLEFYGA